MNFIYLIHSLHSNKSQLSLFQIFQNGVFSIEGGNLAAEISLLSFDKDGNGTLELKEFRDCMVYTGKKVGREFSEEQINAVQKKVDSDTDTRISLQEYTDMIQKGFPFSI